MSDQSNEPTAFKRRPSAYQQRHEAALARQGLNKKGQPLQPERTVTTGFIFPNNNYETPDFE